MGGIKADKLESLVLRFYDAAIQPDLWRGALKRIADVLGADGAAVFSTPLTPALGLHCSERTEELLDWVMRQGPELVNPRPGRALQRGRPGRAITESELFSEWEMKNLPFNVGMVEEVGLRWDAGGNVGNVAGQPIFLTVQRAGNKERFQRADLEAIEALFPHLRRAAALAVTFAQSHAQGMLCAYSCMGCGAILLDFRGRPVQINPIAEQLFGEALRLEKGQLAATNRAANRELQRLIGAVLAPIRLEKRDTLLTVALPRPNGRCVLAQGVPIAGSISDIFHQGKAIILLIDPDSSRQPSDAALRALFKLTPAEARVAVGIGSGKELAEIATCLKIGMGTARTHLKSVMAKTDTHRQAELALLIAQLGLVKSS